MTQNHLAGLPICAERRFGKMGKTIKRLTFSTVCASTTEVKTMFCHYHWLYVSRLRTADPMVGGWCGAVLELCTSRHSAPLRWLPLVTWSPLPVLPGRWPMSQPRFLLPPPRPPSHNCAVSGSKLGSAVLSPCSCCTANHHNLLSH